MIVVVCLWCHYSIIQIRSNQLIWKGEYWLRYSCRVGINNLSCSCMWRGVCVCTVGGGGGTPSAPKLSHSKWFCSNVQFFAIFLLCYVPGILVLAICVWRFVYTILLWRSAFGITNVFVVFLAFCTLLEWTIAFVLLFVATEKTLPSFTAVTFPRFSISETQ